MAQVVHQKVKGCRKCGRSKRKANGKGGALSAFVRGKMSAKDYFTVTNQSVKNVS